MRNNRPLLLVVLLLLLAGGVGLWLQLRLSNGTSEMAVRPSPTEQAGANPLPGRTAGNATDPERPTQQINDTPEMTVNTDGTSEEPRAKGVSIRIQTPSDQPVRAVGVEYAIESVKTYTLGKLRPETAPPLSWTAATSDMEGCVLAQFARDELPCHLLVRPLSMVWRLVGDDFNRLRRDVPDAAAFEVTADTRQVIVCVDQVLRVPLDIRYADGVAFVGHVHLTFWNEVLNQSKPTPRKDLGNFELDVDGEAAFVDLPERAKAVTVNVVGYRFGWENPYGLELATEAQAQSLTVIVPEEREPRGGVRVDLSNLGPGEGWKLDKSGEAAWGPSEPPKWGHEYRDHSLIPDLEYMIRISGPLGVWESESFKVAVNEVREFAPEISRPVSIQLRVVDQKGEPVFPCYASTRFHDLPSWRMARGTGSRLLRKNRDGTVTRREYGTNGSGAPGDTNGVIALSGICQTIANIYVEAEGCERTVVPLSAKPGEHVDLGDVPVVLAIGEIRVKFVNMSAGEKFKVDVSKPRQGAWESEWTDGSDKHTFKALSVNRGTYNVRAFLPNLGGFNLLVTLTPDQPVAEIEIDARKIPRDGVRVETDVSPADD